MAKAFAAESTAAAPMPDIRQDAILFEDIIAKAKDLAKTAYVAPAEAPDFLRSLNREQWRGLLYTNAEEEWTNPDASFRPELLLPGFLFTQQLEIHIIEDGAIRDIQFNPELVQTGDKELAEKLAAAQLGFAGARIHTVETPDSQETRVGVMSASHFQFTGRNARFGVFSQPLTLNTAMPSEEQRPAFREYWFQKQPDEDGSFLAYALMDAPVMTGAFEFTLTPGTSTIVDVRAVFHTRSGVTAPVKIGIAPVTGMFLFSETKANPADYRPEVHNCDGLLVADAEGGWLWSPLKNPERLAISGLSSPSPRGFGLIQRDNNFDHYQDLNNRFDRSTSVWVEPKGDWGSGRIELVELPGTRDFHPNIMACWIPEQNGGQAANNNGSAQNSTHIPPSGLSVEYRLYWMPPGVKMHPLGIARDTRMERLPEDRAVLFYIDFAGGELDTLSGDTGLTSVVTFPKEVTLLDKHLMKNEVTGGWRLTLKLALPQGGVLDALLSARNGPPQLCLSAYLKKGENLTEPLTETWQYTVTP